jgi:hypothetical protein
MTTELHDEFARRYHCPTAVRCEPLDRDGKHYVIVGLPTEDGAIVNDIKGTSLNGKFCT